MADLRPLPGHTIPYHLTDAETVSFLERHRGDFAVVHYLNSGNPPYGIIVNEDYGQLLLWRDASQKVHVIDITNMNIVKEIQKAPFVSPDSSIIDNLLAEIDKLAKKAQPTINLGLNALTVGLVLAVLVLIFILKK